MTYPIWAHRGNAAYAPENTKAAFESGLAAGAAGTELDVHITRDGVPVVIHDHTLERTTNGIGAVRTMQWRELKTLDAGSWYGEAFAGQRIMRLAEVLELLGKTDHQINVELKSGPDAGSEYENAVLREVHSCHMLERVLFSSFDHYLLNRLVRVEPRAKAGILFYAQLYRPWEYAKAVGAIALHPYYQAVQPVWVQKAREHGLDIHAYTVDDPTIAKALLDMGVSSVISNRPGDLIEALGEAD